MRWKWKKKYAMRLSSIVPSSAPWIIVGSSFLQNTGDVVLLELCDDFCISNYSNPKITKTGEKDLTNIEQALNSHTCV